LDLGLPDVDGLGLLDTLKPRLEANGTRVIVHTGRALTKSETRRLEGHAQAIVLKDGDSAARLLEEVRLFVHHIGTSIDKAPGIAETSLGHDSSLEGRKILVVEDDMRTVYSVSALLRSRGSQVIIAENGQEGLDALAANPDIDLVLMDVMMPGMDGYEATRKLRTDPRFEGLPVIVLTAKAMSGERERCLEAGASDYLSKPVDSRSLLAMVGKHLPQRSANG
jgi:CheY-like chemotaxis protein